MKSPFALILAAICLFSCKKEDNSSDTVKGLNLSGIKSGSSTEIININLNSNQVNSTSINCYVLASTVFQSSTSAFGYVDCNQHFNLMNPVSGQNISTHSLPGPLGQVVIDEVNNILIGQYYEADSNQIVTLDLNNGSTLSKSPIHIGFFTTCTYFYNSSKDYYALQRIDSTLMYINPSTGTFMDSVKLEAPVNNGVYDDVNNRLIGITYSQTDGKNYLNTLDAETGKLIYSVEANFSGSYRTCVAEFDNQTNCYVLMNSNNEVLFLNIETGNVDDSYSLDFELSEFKIWRNQ